MGFMSSQSYTITTATAKDMFAALVLDNPSDDRDIPVYELTVQNNSAGTVWFGELSVISSQASFGIAVRAGETRVFNVPSGVRGSLRADSGGSNLSNINVQLQIG